MWKEPSRMLKKKHHGGLHNVLPICVILHLKLFLHADVHGFYLECWLLAVFVMQTLWHYWCSSFHTKMWKEPSSKCLKRNTMEVFHFFFYPAAQIFFSPALDDKMRKEQKSQRGLLLPSSNTNLLWYRVSLPRLELQFWLLLLQAMWP